MFVCPELKIYHLNVPIGDLGCIYCYVDVDFCSMFFFSTLYPDLISCCGLDDDLVIFLFDDYDHVIAIKMN